MKSTHPGAAGHRRWPIVVVFVAIVVLQLALAVVSIDVLSAVRAYVNGESLYSKGQKDAHIHLLGYIERQRDADVQAFERSLAVPLGDRAAREALQQPRPDFDAARRGFLAGGNAPGDVAAMVRLFVWFDDQPFMAHSIATWTEADRLIEQTLELSHEARRQVAAGAGSAALEPLGRQAQALNERLSALETRFSEQLGDVSRRTRSRLIALNVGLGGLLALTAFVFVRRSARAQARTEDALRLREESLQRLLDSAAEGLYGVDVQGRCTFINRAALQMLGHASEADLLGADVNGLVRRRDEGGDESGDEPDICAAFRENRRVHLADALIRQRDGSLLAVECWSHPVVQHGVTQGAVVTLVDISQRLKMQAALRAGELRVMQLVDAVSEGVITIDVDERVVFFNRAAEAIFGAHSIDARRDRIDRFIASPGGGRVRFAELPAGVIELTGIRSDARVFPIEASVSRLDTETGMLLTIVLRDATEQHAVREERRAREALEAASRAKTEFLSRMSHELRTPLNAVLGFSNLLRTDRQNPPTLAQLERIEHIENAGAHLLALVNDVLDVSRVESGRMAVALEPVDLASAVRESFAMVTSLAAEHAVQLRVDLGSGELHEPHDAHPCGSESPRVVADPVRLRQVIVNLLSNAVKYNHSGGRVTLSCRVDDDACVVRIVDTGAGMDERQLQQLFEPFNRLGAEKSNIEGTGIGLVLSRRLTELMGGELRIDSEVGFGTTAMLTLRVAHTLAPSAQSAAVPGGAGASLVQIDVLYAEDDAVNAELVRQILQMRPQVRLRVAETGALAHQLAAAHLPDLVLIDMNLPDMTGTQLALALRQVPSLRDVRLVALSADALPEQIASAMASGFDRYLTKPVDYQELLRVVDGSLRAGAYA